MAIRHLYGGILLIIGTCVGGGMLALPLATAAGGFLYSSLFLLLFWALMTYSAFLILEVALALPPGSNLISMARHTLGISGEVLAWLSYLLLLYSLLSAYMAGGSDLVHSILHQLHLNPPHWLSLCIFTAVFGYIVYRGIRIVDLCNRLLMFTKLAAFVLLVGLLLPGVSFYHLTQGQFQAVYGALILIVTAYGYAIIIPSLCQYYEHHRPTLIKVVGLGSLVPLIVYLSWQFAVIGALPSSGPDGLTAMGASAQPVTGLSQLLSRALERPWLAVIPHYFTAICILTSFLGVSLSLKDFLKDGLKQHPSLRHDASVLALTFLPPMLILLIDPGIFLMGLKYAGVITIILLVLLPGLMAWRLRYHLPTTTAWRVTGGKLALLLQLLGGLLILVVAIWELLP